MPKTVPFQTIQCNISTRFSSIWPIDRTLLGATTPGQSEPWSDSNEGVLCIPKSSSITGTSPSDCFVSNAGHSLVEEGGLTPLAEMQLVYSTAPIDWAPAQRILFFKTYVNLSTIRNRLLLFEQVFNYLLNKPSNI